MSKTTWSEQDYAALDARVHQEIFGWTLEEQIMAARTYSQKTVNVPEYSFRIGAAFKIVDKWGEKKNNFVEIVSTHIHGKRMFGVTLQNWEKGRAGNGFEESMALAITKAGLSAAERGLWE